MKGVLLLISSTRMSQKSVEHAMRICREKELPLHVTFILDSEIAEHIFDQLTTEGFLGDRPGELVQNAVMAEYEIRGRTKIEEICNMARQNGVECNTVFKKGNFLEQCRNIISLKKIEHIVITRRKRSNLSRFIFGSVIEQLRKEFTDVVFEVFDEE
ncbi:MAG: universal stress protein [bacterium]